MRAAIGLEYEMTFAERIEGPLGPTTGSPSLLCWKIAEATLAGPRIVSGCTRLWRCGVTCHRRSA